ncbi:rrp12-like protein [Quercus suber]|uniref:Rrp12-like protein n=1 Tax=Quercus suber TaxID=58331 RepID=A0AAW0IL09_QUESU
MPLAVKLSSLKAVDGSKDDTLSKPEHLEVLYMLSVVKISVPSLSTKVSSKVISEIVKLLNSKFSVLTRHVFQTEKIVDLLVSYVSSGDKNPVDTDISAATLLKRALDILHDRESSLWIRNLPLVCGCLAGLLSSEASIASLASSILKELLSHLADYKTLLTDKDKPSDDEGQESMEASAIKSVCLIFENALATYREISYVFMKSIVLKLADLMILANGGTSNTDHLPKCIGSAVIAMGPERILTLLPISLHADLTCLNIWLIPILKDYVVEASLGYYIENVVPLAKSFERASRKVKKLATSQDLQAHAHDLWGLLPGFCCHPTDTYQNVGALAEILITFLKEDSFMHKNIAIALQVLVYQNKNVLSPKTESAEPNSLQKKIVCYSSEMYPLTQEDCNQKHQGLGVMFRRVAPGSNNLFVDSLPEKRSYLKFVDGEGEFEKLGSDNQAMIDKEQGNLSSTEKEIQRCVIMELASSFVEGAKEDLIDLIYKYITHTFEVTNKSGHCEAYHTLSRILEEHAWFSSSRFVELIDLLLGLKSPVDIASLRSRFASLHILMIHALKMRLEEENTKAFLILNEVILTLKEISASLKDSSAISDAPYHKLIGMIMGYLSGSSPHIKSGAVSALSVLVYQDADICLSMPDIVPSLLSLLHTKVVEIIKAVLGFVKVLVSCLQAKDLHRLLSDVVYEVIVIMEIIIRKCGSAVVESVTPEKYKSFLKTVFEASGSMLEKRKHKAMSSIPEENGSVEQRKRKREKKNNAYARIPSSNEHHPSSGSGGGLRAVQSARLSHNAKSMKGQSEGRQKKSKRNHDQIMKNHEKRKEPTNTSKKDEATHIPNASKLSRHKVGRKRQKINK